MATNKNALIRYQVLDRCFRNPGRRYFINDLLEECNAALREYNIFSEGIGRRQLFDDIKFMKSSQGWNVPLERYRLNRKVYYRYSDMNFSINNQPLSETEVNQIRSALMIMSRFTGTPQFEWINEIIPVLENKLGLVGRDKQVIAFDTNVDLKGLHLITPLFNAIINKTVLKVTYKAFYKTRPETLTYHPYYLKQFNNRWFVLGLNEDEGVFDWNLALDRIENIEVTTLPYKTNDTDWEEYFFDIVGVTKEANKKLEEVVLKFSENHAPYIITKPLHPTQKHNYDSKELIVRIKVIPNFELTKLVLSFGEDVEVIAPQHLRNRIKEKLKKGLDRY